jgi:hypothetical protein
VKEVALAIHVLGNWRGIGNGNGKNEVIKYEQFQILHNKMMEHENPPKLHSFNLYGLKEDRLG